jgi:hypothetical protein
MKFLTLILAAVMTLAFSLPAEAAVSKLNRCKAQVTRAERKYATCVSGTAARALRLGYDTDSSTYQECDNRRGGALTRIAEKFPSLPEADCGLDTASSDARAQAALVVAGLADAAAAGPYNCSLGALCSYWAAGAPQWGIGYYTNDYVGDAPGSGPAELCDATVWGTVQTTMPEYFPFFNPQMLFTITLVDLCLRN